MYSQKKCRIIVFACFLETSARIVIDKNNLRDLVDARFCVVAFTFEKKNKESYKFKNY
jgi:hypothetical protein